MGGWTVGGVAVLTDRWWVAIPTAVVLVGMASIFSTPGDKKNVVVATPGPLRLVIELVTAAVAVAGAWIVWPTWVAVVVTAIVLAALATGVKRARWLAQGAPMPR